GQDRDAARPQLSAPSRPPVPALCPLAHAPLPLLDHGPSTPGDPGSVEGQDSPSVEAKTSRSVVEKWPYRKPRPHFRHILPLRIWTQRALSRGRSRPTFPGIKPFPCNRMASPASLSWPEAARRVYNLGQRTRLSRDATLASTSMDS